MLFRYDPHIGHMWIPSLRARILHERGGYLVNTNAMGFRSDAEFRIPKGCRSRVVILGDSMTAGDGCSNSERFSDVLANMLGVEVCNFGLSGSGTDQQVLIFERYAEQLRPDLVVLCVYVENIERIMASARQTRDRDSGQYVLVPKPYFVLQSGELVLQNSHVTRARVTVAPQPSPETLGAGFLRVSQSILQLFRKTFKTQKGLRLLLDSPLVRKGMLNFLRFQPYPQYDNPENTACLLMQALIRRLKASCQGAPLLVVPIPRTAHLASLAKPNFQRYFAALENVPDGLHIFDLHSQLMRLSLVQRKSLSFDQDVHFSPTGHKVVAECLADSIASLGIGLRSAPATVAPKAREKEYVLGISCYYHNSAACILADGEIVAAAEEERFTRIKHDRSFPMQSINYCLEEAGINVDDLGHVIYYDDPHLTFERLLSTIASLGHGGRETWLRTIPSWVSHKLRVAQQIRSRLKYGGPVFNTLHHRSHAASAYYPSPFDSAAIVTIDGVGEWATATIGVGKGSDIQLLKELRFPNSLGLLYSAFTQFLGFKANSGEYKMMGLAPYGTPRYVDVIRDHVVELKADGSIKLRLEMFRFMSGQAMAGPGFEALFGPARKPEAPFTARDLDLARSVQAVTEECVLRIVRTVHELTGERCLCMAGGVALNCVANGRVLREGPFEHVWVQPAAGDAGGALGAALDLWHTRLARARPARTTFDGQRGSLLGPAYRDQEVVSFLETHGLPYHPLAPDRRAEALAAAIAEGKVVGHFSGRAEYGPRALGARSILADARNLEMQTVLNLKVKHRESFRPFAPAVLEEDAGKYFEFQRPSPYMLIVAPLQQSRRLPFSFETQRDVHELVKAKRSDVPAITHVDYSARVQTVGEASDTDFREVIRAFRDITGCSLVVNTSFNVRGEPIVLTPSDAYRCFMKTDMDLLVMGNHLLVKEEQPEDVLFEREPICQGTVWPDEFLSQVDAMFEVFLANMPQFDMPVGGAGASMWSQCQASSHPKELQADDGEAVQLAEDITRDWASADLQRVTRMVLARLLELGADLGSRELSEEVSDQAYVMF